MSETKNHIFSPIPQIQAAALQILKRLPEADLQAGLSEEGFVTFVGDEAAAAKANKAFEDIQYAYSASALNDAAIKTIIKNNFDAPPVLTDKNRNGSSDIPFPSAITPEQLKAAETALGFLNEKENLKLSFLGTESIVRITGREPGFTAARDTVRDILKQAAQSRKVGRDDVRKLFTERYDEVRAASVTAKKERSGKKERVAGHDTEILTEIDGKQLISLALELQERGSKDCVSAFSRVFGHVEPTHTEDGTPALAVSFPKYSPERSARKKDDKARAHMMRAISMLADRYAANMYDKIKAYNVEHILKETEEGNIAKSFATAAVKEAARPVKPANIVYIPIRSLNTKDVDDFCQYLSHKSRANALKPFEERSELGFAVMVKKDKDGRSYFELSYASDEGLLSLNKLRVAEYMLGQLKAKWENGGKISKATTENLLDLMIKDVQKKYTRNEFGDGIATVFAASASASGVSLALPEIPPTSAAAPAAKKDSVSLVQAVAHPSRVFKPKAHFDLAPWEEDEKGLFIRYTSANGEEELHRPTLNQQAYIAAQRNPNVRTILLHGETGSGKTKWGIRIALEMLQQGVIQTFYYERATATVGRRQYNPYRKGGDTTIFSAVLEDAIATELGKGDTEKGYEVFNTLSRLGMVQRYDQMYRRGDNLEHAYLLGDEAQGKDEEEVFHMITRPKSSSKVVLCGDYKRQNDIGDMSGFAREFKIFSDPDIRAETLRRLKAMGVDVDGEGVKTITFGVEDISRSPYTAFIVMAHEVYDEKYGVEERPDYARDQKAHPSDRYSNPPKHGR